MNKKVLEEMFAQQVADWGLPLPTREEMIIPGRNHRYDFCWRKYRLVVEINGGTFSRGKSGHNSGVGIARDYWKVRRAQDNGWTIYPFDVKAITNKEAIAEVAEYIEQKETRWTR